MNYNIEDQLIKGSSDGEFKDITVGASKVSECLSIKQDGKVITIDEYQALKLLKLINEVTC
jgi:hypothetical protein